MSINGSSRQWIFFCVLVFLQLFACSSEKPAATVRQPSQVGKAPVAVSAPDVSAGSISLEIYPANPTRMSTLQLEARGIDFGTTRVRWYVNGSLSGNENQLSFPCRDILRGTEVYVVAQTPKGDIRTNPVVIGNTPPTLTGVGLLSQAVKPGESLSIDASASDIDGDEVTIQYAWTSNGRPAGTSARIGVPVKRGDKVSVRMTPFDGQAYGESVDMNEEIRNCPPSFIEHSNVVFTGTTYLYQAQTTDPDGDRVSYSLAEPVEGVTVNRESGQVVWTVPTGYRGEQVVTLVANDGYGGSARYTVTFTLR